MNIYECLVYVWPKYLYKFANYFSNLGLEWTFISRILAFCRFQLVEKYFKKIEGFE